MEDFKLKKWELFELSSRLRGRREELAKRAGVTVWTVNNTFQDRHQNESVLIEAKKMIDEMAVPPVVGELRLVLS